MPPKIRITKKDIISAAIEIVREKGEQGINARLLAQRLQCSTQPIFSNFETMEELVFATLEKADELCREYMIKEIEKGTFPSYKASGMAYIRFAKEEKELFKFLYMRDRRDEKNTPESKINKEMEDTVQKNVGLEEIDAKKFHLEMWAFVHGIASMFATNFLSLDWELVSDMLTDVYQGLKKQYEKE